jgi:hypothetical protein
VSSDCIISSNKPQTELISKSIKGYLLCLVRTDMSRTPPKESVTKTNHPALVINRVKTQRSGRRYVLVISVVRAFFILGKLGRPTACVITKAGHPLTFWLAGPIPRWYGVKILR